MPSQWKRGGAFYCIEDESLNAALKKIVTVTDYCVKETNKLNFKVFFSLRFE